MFLRYESPLALLGGPQLVNLVLSSVKKAIQLGSILTRASFQSFRGDAGILGTDLMSQRI